MLIRFFVSNVYSFDEQKEFNMLPGRKRSSERTRLKEHEYKLAGEVGVLKLASMYGANAAGKSNFVNALSMLKNIVVRESLCNDQMSTQFKFVERETPQVLGVEFFQRGKSYYYAIKIDKNIITSEELYESGLGLKDDVLIFERNTDEKGTVSIRFFSDFEKKKENALLKTVIEKNLARPNKPVLKLLTTLNNPELKHAVEAFNWFQNTLHILSPGAKIRALSQVMDIDTDLQQYAQHIMCAFHVGISKLETKKELLSDFFPNKDVVQLMQDVEASPQKMISLYRGKQEMIITKENDKFFIKRLVLEHEGKNGKTVSFNLEEESEGTVRLLDFMPAFKDLLVREVVYVIDEVERSIHPLLIKELMRKFSTDNKTKGQLIFTTHESNLLDQEIFRQDEIWFAEKNHNGGTDLYPLSDFKEHNTKDIRKGYLMGRYGSIPFLGNFQDLNWRAYDD
ncbi:MAG: ATP-binding protein [Prevotellaceae bacterium]|jgi:AAA15 family ATPase/GTPase|nr:ATP-binding protein [Prevotellaceae bacterium]